MVTSCEENLNPVPESDRAHRHLAMDSHYEEYPPGGAIEYEVGSSRDQEGVGSFQDQNAFNQTIDWINTKNPQEMALYQRRMVAGQSFKLPDEPTITDAQWESFKGTFMADLSDDVTEKSRSFRYLWEDEEENSSSARPTYGIARNMIQLGQLMKNNKILREDIEYKGLGNDNGIPSATAWQAISDLTVFTPFKVEADATHDAIEPTNENYRKIVDAIVNFITSEYYMDAARIEHPNAAQTGCVPGAIAKLYFADYTDNVKIMRKAYKCGQVLLTSDLSPNFAAGLYPNYTAIMNAVKRRYGRCRTQDTMVDFFRKLDKIFDDKSPFEFKIGMLRNLLKKYYITESADFFVCKDFEDDRNKQRHPESFTPIVATMLHYIGFSKKIDKSRWEHLEKQYHHQINGKPTYKSWHENRQELYKLMDEEIKNKSPRINRIESQSIYNIDADDTIDEMDDDELIAFVRQRRQNYRKRNPSRGGFKQAQRRYDPNVRKSSSFQNQQRSYPKVSKPSFNKSPNYRNISMNDKKDGLRKLLCRNCSRWSGTNKYHLGPYGGTKDSMCPLDDRGRPRPGFKFIGAYYGTEVNAIGVEDYRDIETDGVEYETSVSQIQEPDNFGMDLITQSIGNFE